MQNQNDFEGAPAAGDGGAGFDFNADPEPFRQNEMNLGEDLGGHDPFRPVEEDEQFGSALQPASDPLKQPSLGLRGPRVLQPPPGPLPPKVVGKEENQEVLKWKNINMVVIALTTFMTIIFLQVLA